MSELDARNCKASLVSFRSDSCSIEQHFSKPGPGNIKVKATLNHLIGCRPLQMNLISLLKVTIYTILQNKRMRRCGVLPPPPPIIFERLKLPQQIIYRRKENLLESPNHLKYRENILISRFYEHFSRNSRNSGHFWKFEKISNS